MPSISVAVVVAFFVCWAPFHSQRLMTSYLSRDQWTFELLDFQSHLFYISGNYISSYLVPIKIINENKIPDGEGTLWSLQICHNNVSIGIPTGYYFSQRKIQFWHSGGLPDACDKSTKYVYEAFSIPGYQIR